MPRTATTLLLTDTIHTFHIYVLILTLQSFIRILSSLNVVLFSEYLVGCLQTPDAAASPGSTSSITVVRVSTEWER